MRSFIFWSAALCLISCIVGPFTPHVRAQNAAGQIVCEGVLGNSGQAGKNLVRFAARKNPRESGGMGVVYDRFGSLWDRAGSDTLNRYALDGRLLASYRIPADPFWTDRISLVGDTLVLLVHEKLHTLQITQPALSSATDLKLAMKCISTNSYSGQLAGIDDQNRAVWIDPKTGQTKVVTQLSFKQIRSLDVMPDGAVIFIADNLVQKIENGQLVNNSRFPLRIHGERENTPDGLQLLDDAWFTQGGHSTIKRYALDFTPSPGVVLGGGSGWVIGRVPSNDELSSGRGMAKITDQLYAVSGTGGIMHLLQWKPDQQRMAIVRRIGSLVDLPGVALDAQGRVSIGMGMWNWTDAPDAPLLEASGPEVLGQMAILDNGMLATAAARYGGTHPAWLNGPLTDDRRTDERNDFLPGGQSPVGAVAVQSPTQDLVLLITAKGDGQIIHVWHEGQLSRILGSFRLDVDPPAKVERWTTLAMETAEQFLAAGDGQIHRYKLLKNVVSYAGMWSPKNEDVVGKFGKSIFISSNAGKLWVSDTQRHRVLCFDLVTGVRLGQFGQTDTSGDDLAHVMNPTAIAAHGKRAVVFDSGNQRLVKLSLP